MTPGNVYMQFQRGTLTCRFLQNVKHSTLKPPFQGLCSNHCFLTRTAWHLVWRYHFNYFGIRRIRTTLLTALVPPINFPCTRTCHQRCKHIYSVLLQKVEKPHLSILFHILPRKECKEVCSFYITSLYDNICKQHAKLCTLD